MAVSSLTIASPSRLFVQMKLLSPHLLSASKPKSVQCSPILRRNRTIKSCICDKNVRTAADPNLRYQTLYMALPLGQHQPPIEHFHGGQNQTGWCSVLFLLEAQGLSCPYIVGSWKSTHCPTLTRILSGCFSRPQHI